MVGCWRIALQRLEAASVGRLFAAEIFLLVARFSAGKAGKTTGVLF